jgi:transcriptional regulator with XRE-family HTH domain
VNTDCENKEYRDAFVEEFVRTGMAFQIKALRRREPWSQKELGAKIDTTQNVISRLESPDYGNLTISTLLRLASAFDVALLVRFVSFSDLWRATQKLSPSDLRVDRYCDEVDRGGFASFQRVAATEEAAHIRRLTSTETRFINGRIDPPPPAKITQTGTAQHA